MSETNNERLAQHNQMIDEAQQLASSLPEAGVTATELTAEKIETALGYVPANEEAVNSLSEQIADLEMSSAGNVVLFTKQTLTEEQKAQARENIGIKSEEGENVAVKDIEYTYDGDNISDAHIWASDYSGSRVYVKVSNLLDDGIDLVGSEVSVVIPNWPQNNYTFTITSEMYHEVSGLTQILYQNTAIDDRSAIAMVVICSQAGEYDINLNGWTANVHFSESGIYFYDGIAKWDEKYVESVIRSGTSASEKNEENPTEYSGNEMQVFTKGLCIGDSITQGAFDYEGGQLVDKKYSYPSILKRITGIEIVNAGVGGFTSKKWYEASIDSTPMWGRWVNNEWVWNENPIVGESDKVSTQLDYSGYDFAIIHLGINDIYLMDTATLDATISTYETNIYNIVNKLKEENTGIKIFLCTIIPSYAYPGETNYEALNEKIREIANAVDDVFLVDLNLYSKCSAGTPYSNSHLTAIGYHRMASDIMSIISYTINQNLDNFKSIQFIGTEYHI